MFGECVITESQHSKYRMGIIDPGDFLEGIRGGSTGFIASILPYLNFRKVTIFGMSINGAVPWKPHTLRKHIEFIPISSVTFPTKIPMRLKCLLSYFRYRKKILEASVDVLYVHSPECCLPFLFYNRNIPVIFHQHGSANPVVRSKYAFGRNRLFQGIFESISKLIYKKADWIIAIDRLCLTQAVQNGAGNKSSLLLNAVDAEQFKPNTAKRIELRNRLRIEKDCYAILFVGRLEKPKGAGYLLRSIPFLKSRDLNFHIYLAGDGSFKKHFKNYVARNRFETQVTFLGQVSHNELPLYYNMADILVLPSEMEGIPMVILEALACGTPVVASNVGGIPDLIVNGTNGIISDDLDPERLASAIIDALRLDVSPKQISESVAELSADRFVASLDKIISNLLTVQ
jgi:glycosyltransferase involved in cell wall biosynthesis